MISKKWSFALTIINIVIFAAIVVTFAAFDIGLGWDNLENGEYNIVSILFLILYRILLYSLPFLINYAIINILVRHDGISQKDIAVKSANIMLFTYAIISAFWIVLAADVWICEIFSTLDSFVFIAGLLITNKRKILD